MRQKGRQGLHDGHDPTHALGDIEEREDRHDDEKDLHGEVQHRDPPVGHHQLKGLRGGPQGARLRRGGRVRLDEKGHGIDGDHGGGNPEERCLDGVETGFCLDDPLLDEVVADEKEVGQQGHLGDGEGQDRHGRNAAVDAREPPDDDGKGRHGRQAHESHEGRKQKIQPAEPPGPGENGRQKGDGDDDLHHPEKRAPPPLQSVEETFFELILELILELIPGIVHDSLRIPFRFRSISSPDRTPTILLRSFPSRNSRTVGTPWISYWVGMA